MYIKRYYFWFLILNKNQTNRNYLFNTQCFQHSGLWHCVSVASRYQCFGGNRSLQVGKWR